MNLEGSYRCLDIQDVKCDAGYRYNRKTVKCEGELMCEILFTAKQCYRWLSSCLHVSFHNDIYVIFIYTEKYSTLYLSPLSFRYKRMLRAN